MKFLFFSLLIPLATSAPQSQHTGLDQNIEATPDTSSDIRSMSAVIVQGLVETTIGSYQDLLSGAARFNELQPRLSPTATLLFSLPPDVFEIYIKHPSKGLIRIPVNHNGEFSVPIQGLENGRQRGERWPLLVRSLKVSEVLPAIYSSRSSESEKFVGDLRLYCETLWATQKENVSGIQKIALRMMGGMCNSKRIAFTFPTKQRLIGAEIEGATMPLDAKISYNGMGFSLPLHNQSLTNSARVKLIFEKGF